MFLIDIEPTFTWDGDKIRLLTTEVKKFAYNIRYHGVYNTPEETDKEKDSKYNKENYEDKINLRSYKYSTAREMAD